MSTLATPNFGDTQPTTQSTTETSAGLAAQTNIQPNEPCSIAQSPGNELSTKAQGEAQEEAQGEVQEEAQSEVQKEAHGEVQKEAQEEAQGEVQEEAQGEVQEEVQGEAQGGDGYFARCVSQRVVEKHGQIGELGKDGCVAGFDPKKKKVQMRGELGSNKLFEVTQEYLDDFESVRNLVAERSKISSVPKLRVPLDDKAYYDDLSDDDEVVPGRQINQKDAYTIDRKAFREWQKRQTVEKPAEEEAYTGPALRPPVDDTSDHDDDFYSDDEVDTAHHGLKKQTCDLQVPENLSRFYGLPSTMWHDSDVKGNKTKDPASGPTWKAVSARTMRDANKAFVDKYWKDGVKVGDDDEEYTGPVLSPPIDDDDEEYTGQALAGPIDDPPPSLKRRKDSDSANKSPETSSSTFTQDQEDQDAEFDKKANIEPSTPSNQSNETVVEPSTPSTPTSQSVVEPSTPSTPTSQSVAEPSTTTNQSFVEPSTPSNHVVVEPGGSLDV